MKADFVLYVDFDSTLYNTKEFAVDLFALIAQNAGVDAEQVAASSKQFYANPELGGYDYAAHVASYKLDIATMWRLLESMLQAKNYLYTESPKFIQLARQAGYDPKILSFGEQKFQLVKIRPTLSTLTGGDGKNLEVTVVDRKKHEHIRTLHQGQTGVLIDDVPGQDLPTGFSEIHLDRSAALHHPTRKDGGFVVSNLGQALEVIKELSN